MLVSLENDDEFCLACHPVSNRSYYLHNPAGFVHICSIPNSHSNQKNQTRSSSRKIWTYLKHPGDLFYRDFSKEVFKTILWNSPTSPVFQLPLEPVDIRPPGLARCGRPAPRPAAPAAPSEAPPAARPPRCAAALRRGRSAARCNGTVNLGEGTLGP